jgi:hypothetical protein
MTRRAGTSLASIAWALTALDLTRTATRRTAMVSATHTPGRLLCESLGTDAARCVSPPLQTPLALTGEATTRRASTATALTSECACTAPKFDTLHRPRSL